MIRLLVKKTTDGCSFCSRRETFFIVDSTYKKTKVLLCVYCAEHLAAACNAIEWKAQQ